MKRRGRGTWGKDRIPIFILVQRGGVRSMLPSSDVGAETALRVIGRHVLGGSRVYTDCFGAYVGLGGAGYVHECVNHSAGEYVRGVVHVSDCECGASLLRSWLAVHKGISKENVSLYLAAFKVCGSLRGLRLVEALAEILKI